MKISKEIYSEATLVDLLQNKEVVGLEYLYDNYSGALYGAIVNIVRSSEIADEVLQDAFLKIWNKCQEYDVNKGKLFTWMLRITRNLAIDKIRSKEVKNAEKTEGIEAVKSYEDKNTVLTDIDNIGFKAQLKVLSKEQMQVIEWIYYQGYSHSEVSKKYGIPIGTVKTRVRSALGKLRKVIPKEFS